ncbi:MAG: hypothetical protein ACRDPK_17655 [Carbonactinosporaceae bacterium]
MRDGEGDVAVDVLVAPDGLVARVRGVDQLWAFRRNIRVPMHQIDAVRVMSRAAARAELPWVRAPGSYLPGLVIAGSYWHLRRRRRQFWCVHRAAEVLVIDVRSVTERLVLQVVDPWAAARDIGHARARVACHR